VRIPTSQNKTRMHATHHHHHHHHKHPGLGHLARSVSRVTVVLSIVSLVSQLFSSLVGCKGMILKGFSSVALFVDATPTRILTLTCSILLVPNVPLVGRCEVFRPANQRKTALRSPEISQLQPCYFNSFRRQKTVCVYIWTMQYILKVYFIICFYLHFNTINVSKF